MGDLSALPPAVRAYVRGFAVRDRRLAVARGAGWSVALFLGWALGVCVADRFGHLPAWVRLALLAAGTCAAAVPLALSLRRALRRDTDWVEVAERIEEQEPWFGQRLVTVTSRLLGRPEYRGSDEILEHLVYQLDRQTAEELEEVAGAESDAADGLQGSRGSRVPRLRALRRLPPLRTAAAPWAASAGAVLLATLLARVPDLNLPRLAHRYFAPLTAVPPVTTTRLRVSPGDRDVPQGAPLQIEVTAERLGDSPVWLLLSDDGVHWSRSAMNWAGEGRFTYTINPVDRDVWYSVAGGDTASGRYAVRVLRRPAVAEFRLRYVYPAYTGKPPLTVTNTDGVIEAPVGSEVLLTIAATEPLQSALLNVGGQKVLMGRVAGTGPRASNGANVANTADAAGLGSEGEREARFLVLKDGPYDLDLISTRGQPGSGPPTMAIRALPDHPPQVRVPSPRGVVQLGPRGVLPVAFDATDDYGVESVVVRARVYGRAGAAAVIESPVPPSRDLAGFPPGVGDVRQGQLTTTAETARSASSPAAAGEAGPARPPLRREGLCRVDLATLDLAAGDAISLELAVRDTGGQVTTSRPVYVLASAHPIDPAARQRAEALTAAARRAAVFVDHVESAAAALSQAADELDRAPALPQPSQAAAPASSIPPIPPAPLIAAPPRPAVTAALARANRRLALAGESAAAIRRSLLRAAARTRRADAPQLADALAGWLDSAQVQAAAVQSVLRAGAIAAGPERSEERGERAAAERLRASLRSARELQSQLLAASQGEQARMALAARQNLSDATAAVTTATAGAASTGPATADPRRQIIQAAREELAADVAAADLRGDAADLDPQLAARERAGDGAAAAAAARPIDFAAAADRWSQDVQSDPSRAGPLDERLATAALAEALRPDGDLPRARDLHLASRAAAALAGAAASAAASASPGGAATSATSAAPDRRRDVDANDGKADTRPTTVSPAAFREFADAVAAVLRDGTGDDRPTALADRPRAAGARPGAAQARQTLARLADEFASPATAFPASSGSRTARVESLAFAAAAELASRDYSKASELDDALARQLAVLVAAGGTGGAGGRPATRPQFQPPPPPASPDAAPAVEGQGLQQGLQARQLAEVRLARDAVRQSTGLAETIDTLLDRQRELDKRADAVPSDAAARLQREVAADVSDLCQRANPLTGPLAVALAPAATTAATDAADAGNGRDRAMAAVLAARRALEAIRPNTTTTAEAATAPSSPRATSRPADWGAADAVAARLDAFAPETAVAAGVIRSRLGPALHALVEADHAGDEAAAIRAAAEARQAIDDARWELARVQDAMTDRDPLTAARWLTRSAADLLGRAPPDGAGVTTAAAYQREAEAALARAWDLSVHRAASERLAGLPWVRPLLAGAPVGPPLGPPADLLAAEPSPVAVAANDTEAVGGGVEAADDAAPRDAIPAEYEPSLELYFKAIERTRGGSR